MDKSSNLSTSPEPRVYVIKNNSKNTLLLKVGLGDECKYETKNIGCIVLPSLKTYKFENTFMPQLLQISIGIVNNDNTIGVMCYELPLFDMIFEIDDSYIPYKEMSMHQFKNYYCEEDDELKPSDASMCNPKYYTITNKTSTNMLLGIGLYDVTQDEIIHLGWIYLPPNKIYTYVNEFITKTFIISGGFNITNDDSVHVICEDMPIFEDIIFDETYKPFMVHTFDDFSYEISNTN